MNEIQKCVLTQFYDGGASSTLKTFLITKWSDGVVIGEDARLNEEEMNSKEVAGSDISNKCLIFNIVDKQVFMTEQKKGQSCEQIGNYLKDGNYYHFTTGKRIEPKIPGFLGRSEQLCSLGEVNIIYKCPHSPLPVDKHAVWGPPTPTSHVSNGKSWCEDWFLNSAGEWQNKVTECSQSHGD